MNVTKLSNADLSRVKRPQIYVVIKLLFHKNLLLFVKGRLPIVDFECLGIGVTSLRI